MNDLNFIWPSALSLILLSILSYYLYSKNKQGRSTAHMTYSDLSMVIAAKEKAKKRASLAIVLYIAALVIALVALARPTAKFLQPDNLSGIVFTLETSRSMQSWDIEPTRLAASQAAAKELISTIPKSIKVGLATFSGSGVLNVPLTTDHDRVNQGIDNLSAGGDFAFTYGIIAALKALPEDLPDDGIPGAIVLFSHGHDRSNNNPIELAEIAAERGIPIHTIGVGTHGNNFGEDILKTVADISGGNYYPIFSAADLQKAHEDLGKIIRLRPRTTEVTALPALIAAFLLMTSLIASQLKRPLT